MSKIQTLYPLKLEDLDNPPDWATEMLRSINGNITALQSVSGGLSLSDNLQCEISTANFSHGVPQLVTLRKQSKATAILCWQAGGGANYSAQAQSGSKGLNFALSRPPVFLGLASATGGDSSRTASGLPRAKVICYFDDVTATRVPVTMVFVNEPGMASSGMAPVPPNPTSASYNRTAAQTIATATATVMNFDTQEYDTDTAVTTGAGWKFTIPAGKAGKYSVSSSVAFGAGFAAEVLLSLFKNGTEYKRLSRIYMAAGQPTAGNSTVANCAAGDTLDIRVQQGSGVNQNTEASPVSCWVTIYRLAGGT